jgi:uncharacterized protein YbdZ (MbtH family)
MSDRESTKQVWTDMRPLSVRKKMDAQAFG